MERIILHIDVNSAFLSWSAIKLLREGYSKDIRNEVAVISGSESKRKGIIVASSLPAKKLGIKSPTNLFEARKIYKNLIVIRPDRDFYEECSNSLINYLKTLFPELEQYSIDECFIDYTSMKLIYGDVINYAYKLKDEILKKFGFTVNIGIGNNKLCAKMASDFEKPNKVHTLFKNEIKEKMWPLDISSLFMAGKSSCKKLRTFGINTIGDLANYNKDKLICELKSHGKMLYEYANGIDDSPVYYEPSERKGVGISRTFEYDIDGKEEICRILKDFSKKISSSLKEKNMYSNVFIITIRYSDFKTFNHQKKYINSTNDEVKIYNYSKEIFNKLWNKNPIRLLGLRAVSLSHNKDYQLSIFDIDKKVVKNNEIETLIDKINRDLGKNSIFKGSKLGDKEDNKLYRNINYRSNNE